MTHALEHEQQREEREAQSVVDFNFNQSLEDDGESKRKKREQKNSARQDKTLNENKLTSKSGECMKNVKK